MEPGKWTLLAEDYIPIFRKLDITCVIRFNKRCYDRRRFTEVGIKHVDLFYEDGGNPTEEILQRFLKICENTKARKTLFARRLQPNNQTYGTHQISPSRRVCTRETHRKLFVSRRIICGSADTAAVGWV